MNILFEKLNDIEKMLSKQHLEKKELLNSREAADFLSITLSNLYKHTMNRAIPFYKFNRKLLFFKRTELENWIFENRVATIKEIGQSSSKFQIKQGRVN